MGRQLKTQISYEARLLCVHCKLTLDARPIFDGSISHNNLSCQPWLLLKTYCCDHEGIRVHGGLDDRRRGAMRRPIWKVPSSHLLCPIAGGHDADGPWISLLTAGDMMA